MIRHVFTKSKLLLVAILAGALFVTGCDDNEDFIIPPPPANAGPQAVNDNYNALGNSPLVVTAAQGVRANDVHNGALVTAFDAASTQGGVVNVNADGSFTYNPPANFVGQDTFTYTISNVNGNSTATVTITVANLAFYVDNTAPGGGNGTFANPYNTLALALADPNLQAGDTIFVFAGDGTATGLTGPFVLPNGVSLIGEGLGLNFNNGINPREDVLAQQIVNPGNQPMIVGPVSLLGANTVAGFLFDGSPDDAINAAGVNGLVVDTNTFQNNAFAAIDFDNVGGEVDITNNTFNAVGGSLGVDLDNLDTDSTLTISLNTFQDDNLVDPDDAVNVNLMGTSQTTFNADGNTITGGVFGTSWSDGLELLTSGTSMTTVNWSGNNIDNTDNEGLEINTSDTAQVTAILTNNTSNTNATEGFEIDTNDSSTLTLTMVGDTLNNNVDDGIDADVDDTSTFTLITDNLTANNNGDDGLDLQANNMSTINVGLRNSTITGNTDVSVEFVTTGTSSMCADITGNTADTLEFDRSAGTMMDVERFDAGTGGPLDAVNTLTNANSIPDQMPTAVNAGDCNIPLP